MRSSINTLEENQDQPEKANGIQSSPIIGTPHSQSNEGLLSDGLYQGDCIELMQKIEDQSIDMILCDLPYGTTQNNK